MLRASRSWLSVFVVALVGFVFPLTQGGISYATPLDTWTQRTSGTAKTLYGVTYGNGIFVAVGGDVSGSGGTIILTSADGATWTERTSGLSNYFTGVTYGNGVFVAVSSRGTILTSTDGVSWTQRVSGTTNGLYGLTYGNGMFVTGGIRTILSSTDGVTWTQRASPTHTVLGVIYGNGTFVAVGWHGGIHTSTDGVTWTQRVPYACGTSYILEGVTYGNGTFVAVGSSGKIFTSTDGVTWSARSSGTSSDLTGVTYGNGTFVAVSDGFRTTVTYNCNSGSLTITGGGTNERILLTSTDGASWDKKTFYSLNKVTYGNGTFVAVGYNGAIYQSASVGPLSGSYQGVWWAGASENGWGLALTQHGNTLVAGWYYYDGTGRATWSIMPGCSWNTSFTTCAGSVYDSTGAWFGNYSSANFAQTPVGTLTFSFTDANNGTMSYVVNGLSGQKTVNRLNFGSGTAPSSIDYTDVWWGGANQNGWGLALAQQQGILVGSWYTYDSQGRPTWFVMPGGTWTNSTTYQGTLIRATGSPLLGTVYNSALYNATSAGQITIQFSDANNALMTYTVDGVTQTKSISRLLF